MTIAISTGQWVRIRNEQAHKDALHLARGTYQADLLLGHENLSGSTLRGKAKSYSGKYAASRDSLLRRMTVAGISWHEERGDHNKRILVIG